ncbi:hypothetical protein A3D88_03760 [Candidatus Peribacteria bacterium RIFCSPHIGHO2_02_FULL_52_16]|nr:MAG: hypothetical protein A2706_04575 [Candidatus Peribacteria bacterium RIFCSPHIGHO2_01_FULL_51_35]OGJ61797.1 MAG: hypothetical protein A3D88_03760 [Candidatus Peribacteria bacterium RIFCSPHIGHO2_02_FULL_52_16]
MPSMSVRHHYLPQCYLKGFLDSDGYLHVYDKKERKFFSTKGTEDVFQEKHRNSIQSPMTGERKDIFEGLYSEYDSLMAPLLKKIIESKHTAPPPLDLDERWGMMLCLAHLHWRVPARDRQGKDLIEKHGFRSSFFNIRHSETGEPISNEMMKEISNFDGMDKAYKMGISFAPFHKKSSYESAQHWKFLYQDPGFNITGDDPILRRQEVSDFGDILNEFVFPVSAGRTIISNVFYPSRNPEHGFCLKVGIAIIEQAERFVCGNNMSYLQTLVQLHNQSKEVLENVGTSIMAYLYDEKRF